MTQTHPNQALQAYQIETDGYYLEHLGHVRTLDHYHRFYFFINLTQIQDNLSQLDRNTNLIQRLSFQNRLVHKLFNQLWMNCREIEKTINKLMHYRSKRALANVLGRTIRFITGNLDDEDLQSINQNLEKLFSNQEQISSKVQKFTTFANHFTKQYDTEFRQLRSQINTTAHLLSKLEKENDIVLLIQNEIFFSEKLLESVKMIERTITLAFNGITNLELFTYENLRKLYDYLNSTYEQTQLIKLDSLHPFKMLEFTKFHIIFANNTLAFILKLPILCRQTYKYYQIYPIPNKYNQILIPETTYYLTRGNQEIWMDTPCNQIEEVTFCDQPPKLGCKLLANPRCTYAQTKNKYQLQAPLRDGTILISSNHPQDIIENCRSETNKKTLTGSHIILSTCEIIIGDTVYPAETTNLSLNIPSVDTVEKPTHQLITLRSEHLKDFKQLRKDLEDINDDTTTLQKLTNYGHYSITTLLLILAIIIACITFKHRRTIQERIFRPKPVVTLESIRQLLQRETTTPDTTPK